MWWPKPPSTCQSGSTAHELALSQGLLGRKIGQQRDPGTGQGRFAQCLAVVGGQ